MKNTPNRPRFSKPSRIAAAASSVALLAAGAATVAFVQVAAAPKAAALANGLGLTPQMGWNSWNAYHCNITEQNIKDAADSIVSSGLKAVGYQYVNIDDCWQASTRDADGNLQADPTRFPDGIKALADYVHADGLKLGIYATPGTKTCGELYNSYPGSLGSLGHEKQDADQFAAWGVDYLKYDWCDAKADNVDRQTAFTTMSDDLKSTGRPIFYSIHDQPESPYVTWRATVADSWRTTTDIGDSWSSMISKAHTNWSLAADAGPGAWNDPDMLEVGNGGMTDAEYRTHFSLWAEMAAPLIAGTNLADAGSATMQILGNAAVIAVDQDPLGKQGTLVTSANGLDVLAKPLKNGDVAVTLTNENSTTQTISTTASAVGLGTSSHYTLVDLWSGRLSTNTTGTISASVPSHATVMYRISTSAQTVEAEDSGNSLGGAAVVESCTACSGGKKVAWIGNGSANYLTVKNVQASVAAPYAITISYALSGTRAFFISVNGGANQKLTLTGSSWTMPATATIVVPLKAGTNTITFHNDSAYAPDLDKVTIS